TISFGQGTDCPKVDSSRCLSLGFARCGLGSGRLAGARGSRTKPREKGAALVGQFPHPRAGPLNEAAAEEILQSVGIAWAMTVQQVWVLRVPAIVLDDTVQTDRTERNLDQPILDGRDRRFAAWMFGQRRQNIERDTQRYPLGTRRPRLREPQAGSRSQVAPPAVASRPHLNASAPKARGQFDGKLYRA